MMIQDAEVQTESHELTIEVADRFAQMAGYRFYGECSCHNPDGEGEGRTDVLASFPEEIEEWHSDHLLALSR